MQGVTAAPSLFWFVARGSGVVAYILLTATVVMGIALSRRWHNSTLPRLAVEESHRWLTLTLLLFLAVHTVTVLLDPFTKFGLKDVAVPFGSAYRTVWLGLGVLASEMAIALAASVLVRRWIGYRLWYALHLTTYLLFPLSLLHGLGAGSDTKANWATLLYGASVVAVAGALLWRTAELRVWRRWVLVGSLVGPAILLIWAKGGPYAPGWAATAGTPKQLIQAGAQQRGLTVNPAATPTPTVPTLPQQLNDTVSGAVNVGGRGAQLMLLGAGTGSTPVDVALQVLQGREQISGQVQLRTANHLPLCAGPVTGVQGQNTILATCAGYGQQVQLQLTLQSLDAQSFQGVLRAVGAVPLGAAPAFGSGR